MAIINKDQDIVNQGRKAPFKDSAQLQVSASLRDQIPQKLANKLRDMEIVGKVEELWNTGNANRAVWLERQQEYLSDWDEFLTSTADGPFAGSSTLHLPVPLIVAKTMHARFMQALLGIEPYFTLKARTEGVVDRADMVQDVMMYAIKDWGNHRRGMESSFDTWVWDWVTTGSGILKARWDVQYERYMDVHQVLEHGPARFLRDTQGKEQTVPTGRLKEEEFVNVEKTFEGPIADWIPNEDLLIIGGEGNPQAADSCHHTQWVLASDLWTLVDRQIFDEKEVEKIIASGPDQIVGAQGTPIKAQRAMDAGRSQTDTKSALDRYRIVESYLNIDVDGSGINSKVVTWSHFRSRALPRATYLRRINKAGEVPFFKIDFQKRPGQDYGIGLIEMLHPLSKELDAMHNMRIDFGLISNMPYGFYRPTSSIEPTTMQLEPGMLVPVDNPQTDVYFPNLGNRTAFGMQEEASIYQWIERFTGINDMNLGIISGQQGATRTATGARALMGESNANLDVYLRRLQGGFKPFLQFLLHMLQQRIPEGLSFRVTGESGNDYWRKVRTQQDIAGDYDFEVSPNSSNSNKSIQQDVAQQIMQATTSPLDIQLGIVTPAQRYEALKAFYRSLGVKDYGKYVQKPPDYQYMPSPEEEANRILRGVDVPVLPNMDHKGFVAYFKTIHDSDELLGQFSKEQTLALAKQAQKHEQMQASLDHSQAQQDNRMQAAINSQVSTAQSSPGGNPFQQGGVAGASVPQPPIAANG